MRALEIHGEKNCHRSGKKDMFAEDQPEPRRIMTRIVHFIFFALVGVCLAGCNQNSNEASTNGSADAYPSRTVTVICPWAAGGGTDRLARFFADRLQQRLGKPFVVANKTGGSGAVGHSEGARAKPDGYTILMATFELSTMHWMGITDLTYEDYEPVIQMNADAAAIIVLKDAPWQNLNGFIGYIKNNPGAIKMSGTATGGAWDLARAGFQLAAGLPIDSVVWVPAKGAAPSLVELMGGHIEAVCCSLPEAGPQIEAGELRPLAVMAPERLPEYPETPTVKEAGVDWVAVGWRGLMLPKGTPQAIVDRLSKECAAITESDAFKNFMKKNGFSIVVRQGEEFTRFLAEQDAQWKKVIEAVGYAKP